MYSRLERQTKQTSINHQTQLDDFNGKGLDKDTIIYVKKQIMPLKSCV